MEIERKFLINTLPYNLTVVGISDIEQGYLCLGNKEEVRLRHIEKKGIHSYYLTVKRGSGMIRGEVEVEINSDTATMLWSMTEDRRITKRRLHVVDNCISIDIDIYDGSLKGLIIAEIEFPSEEEALAYTPLSWMTKEVTNDERYKNRELATKGIPQ